MESKEIDINNPTCYYIDDIVRVMDSDSNFDFNDIFQTKSYIKKKMKIFWFMTFHTKI